VQYYIAQPQGILSPGSGPDHTPAYIPSYAMEGFPEPSCCFSSLDIVNVKIINKKCF
jgi:hypothetical protein